MNRLAERAVQTFKERLRQISGGSVSKRLAKFLFKYRIMPHSSIGELLMGRHLRSRLNLIKPDLSAIMENKQFKQKQPHDKSKSYRTFTDGETVYIKFYNI